MTPDVFAPQPTADTLLGEARVRLLDALCGTPQTAAELATRVQTTANAVRVHLAALRKAGLVDFEVHRHGVGKPRHVYSITSSAEYLLSAAYAPVLNALLRVLGRRLNGQALSIIRESGAELSNDIASGRGDEPDWRAATRALVSLGRPVKVVSQKTGRTLMTQCCPLAAISRQTERACVLMEAMLSAASGVTVEQQCERGDHPRCVFLIPRARTPR